jgi:acyl-coenzyme A synthetase/AMP-(fatty) acid ligase
MRPGAAVPRAVTGPRLARAAGAAPPREARLDDLVVATGPRSFRRLGRHTRLVKVNGRRVHLDDLERRLSVHTGLEFSCRPVPDPLRGEWFVLDVVGDAAAADTLASLCRRVLPRTCQPRAIRPVRRLARTITGKIR